MNNSWEHFFNPHFKRPELQAYVLSRLSAQLEYVSNKSDFYRCRFGQKAKADVSSLEQFAFDIPITHSLDISHDQSSSPPFGTNLCIPENKIWRIQGTSGTTGQSKSLAFSANDWALAARQMAYTCRHAGMRSSDRLMIAMPLHIFVGGWGLVGAAEQLGCSMITAGGLAVEKQIELLASHHVTVLVSTPSYALYLLEASMAKGIDMSQSDLRLGLFGGEPGISKPNFRNRIEIGFGIRAVDFGNTAEVHPCSNMSCACGPDMHLYDNIVYCELVDPDNPARIVAPGETGVLVYTHLNREAMPMVRFWSGDTATYTWEPCGCGLGFRRIVGGINGRIDDRINHRGFKFYPSDVYEVVASIDSLNDQFAIVETEITNSFRLFVEVKPNHDQKEAHSKLQQRLHEKLLCRMTIQLVAVGSIPKLGLKPKRVWRQGEDFQLLPAPQSRV